MNNTETSRLSLSKLDYLFKAFSIFLSFLIILNLIKWSLYYSTFKVVFADYIDFSEAFLLFFNDIILSVIVLLYLLFSAFAAVDAESIKNVTNKSNRFPNASESMNLLWLILIAILLTLYLKNIRNIELLISLSVPLFLIGFLILIYKSALKKLNKNSPFNYESILKYLWPFLIVIFFSLLSLYTKSNKILHKSSHLKIECTFNNGQILKSNNDTVYLGRSKNYIFLYDFTNKKSVIYQTKDINKIEFLKSIKRND